MLTNLLVIGLGGFIGAVARYLTSAWVGQRWGRSFPAGTFAVNIIGCLIIGFITTLFMEKFFVSAKWRAFVLIGFIGSFTTFSTFEYETAALLQDGEWFMAAMNVILSVVVGFMALKMGQFIARSI
ncbi:MAG: fluoride efflux transporter CrcB [Nitrospirae bacterium]|nr:MAG: fluoride efflux transporter CrcB [Nitrospirota bacterium]